MAALCLAVNSQTWETSFNLLIRSATHSNLVLFASLLNWDRRHEGVSIYISSMASAPYTMLN